MNDDRRLQRGILLYEQSNYPAAEKELRQALLEDPGNPITHSILALCLSQRKEYEEATREARTAITQGPDIGLTHYAHASILHDRNRFDEALEAINVASTIDPQNTAFLSLYASLLFSKSRWEDALRVADRGLEIDPDHEGCGNMRAAALVKLGRHQEAEKTIDGMLEKGPTNSASHANLGWSLLHQGDHRKASQHFREALRLDPNSEWARQGMLECLKARNFLYRQLLRFFLFMSTLSREGQWGVIIGLWLSFQVVRRIGRVNPEWSPYLAPFLYLYVAFAALTWIGTPLFNLLLRLDRFGRYILSDEERADSNIFGLAVLTTAVLGVLAIIYGGVWTLAVFISGMMLLPLAAMLRCSRGWPRWGMILYMLGLFLVGAGILVNESLAIVFVLGCVLSSVVGNVLASITPKK